MIKSGEDFQACRSGVDGFDNEGYHDNVWVWYTIRKDIMIKNEEKITEKSGRFWDGSLPGIPAQTGRRERRDLQ